MRILLTNITLGGRTGTETVTRDLALGYLEAGCAPTVYTRRLGPIADELKRAGVAVTDRVEDLAGPFDVIHGHHLNACIAPPRRGWPTSGAGPRSATASRRGCARRRPSPTP
jgi:hypothetical protein